MGTRSTTTVYDGEVPIVSIYRQYDGYLDGHGEHLVGFLQGKEIVNGFGSGDGEKQFFNGAGDLAMRLITHLKGGNADRIGSFYIVPFDQAGDQEYHYDVIVLPHGSEPFMRVKCYGELLAEGPVSQIIALATAAEAEEADDE
jgi:hypothetical protein